MKKKAAFLIFFPFFITGFANAQSPTKNTLVDGLTTGVWRAVLYLNDSAQLPFNFIVFHRHDSTLIKIVNAKERIEVNELSAKGDSLIMHLPFFDTEIRARYINNLLTGNFINHTRKTDNVIRFSAQYGLRYRFFEYDSANINISGRYLIQFAADDAESKNSIGEFTQTLSHVEGTILTTTGDYRYLDGVMQGDTLYLSSFDGSHAYLFKAICKADGSMKGDYYSGKHWHDTWIATRNDTIHLADPDKFSFMREGADHLAFRFPDADSNLVSFPDDKYKNKVVIIQVMGTWCPNCLDESMFLTDFYKSNKAKGLEIVALDFERLPEFTKASANIKRLKKRLDIQYPVLFAGSSASEERGKALPQLNRIYAFPTTIFIDKKGNVRKTESGYTGPATNEHYAAFLKEFNSYVNKLLTEK